MHPSVINGGQCPPCIKIKTGDAQRANQVLSSMEAVTADDILRVARTYLREDNRTVVVLKPVSPEESETLGPLA
jgi:3-deoxy-D-arabino-heptulosonate 7-phosphate (DAHP) synthase